MGLVCSQLYVITLYLGCFAEGGLWHATANNAHGQSDLCSAHSTWLEWTFLTCILYGTMLEDKKFVSWAFDFDTVKSQVLFHKTL